MEKKEWIFLSALFAVVMASRLYFTLTTPHFTPDAYFHVRIVEQIMQHGRPLVDDMLSFGGRQLIISPFFYYILALPAKLAPVFLKIIPQLFVSTLPITVYAIVRKITGKMSGAALSAILTATIPVIFTETLFSLTPLTITLPLTFIAFFFFMHEKKSYTLAFLISAAILSILHPSSIFLALGLLLYLVLGKIEKLDFNPVEWELAFFATFLFLWIHFIIYKKALLTHGIAIIWQNIPPTILSQYFTNVSLPIALIQIGLIPLAGGIVAIYTHLFKVKNKYIYMYTAVGIVTGLFTWLRLIEPRIGFMYVGVCASILSGPLWVQLAAYTRKMKFRGSYFLAAAFSIAIIIGTMVMPSMSFAQTQQRWTVSEEMDDALQWINQNSEETSTILAPIDEGHLITAIAQRKNVVDSYFLLTDNGQDRVEDVEEMYTTQFPTEAVKLFNKYGVDYILFSKSAKVRYRVTALPYDKIGCVRKVYENRENSIYRSKCKIEVESEFT